ncbi:tetratricopeptide repeat protein [uncultured Psychroserpens sp.]|uniref:tetratricopeptide repeat protein n=1 Tax=uncultured Psychroserpens sp. TaxID=255436 RepID=UPI00262112F3|nr:tetratricopeptide repeat protein [uncultured Psychroserpens sp.]
MQRFLIVLLLLSFCNTDAQNSVLITADSLFAHGNYSKAITLYKSYNKPTNVYHKIAKSYVALGNHSKALKYYELSVDAYPKDALTKYEYAKLLSSTKKYQLALDMFNDLIIIDDENPNYHYEMGLVLERINDSTAINRFKLAYDLDQTHQKTIYKIAKYFLKKRKHQLSHNYIDKGLETYENNVKLINLKAQNYYYQDYYKEAKIWFNKLIDLGESSEFIHEKLSIIYAEDYEFEKAINQRKLALKFNPKNAKAMFVIATYYEQLKDYENAEKYMIKFLKLTDVALDHEYQKLGIIYNRQKKHKQAIEAFNRALKENPENASAAFFIVATKDSYYSDIDAKIKVYETFIKTYSNSPFESFAKSRLTELKEEKFSKSKE